MSVFFNPTGPFNVAYDASDLPEQAGQNSVSSGSMVRCKNIRLNEGGKAKTRDGSAKINVSAIDTSIWWIEEQAGYRYSFAGTYIYKNETVVESGLTSAQWTAIKYNAFNDTAPNVFALNGTDRKRIQNGYVFEWGIDAPTVTPTLSVGGGAGLTGTYKVKYTYVRKAGNVVICESNPSPASAALVLSGTSLSVDVEQPTDPQVTHIRLYRTFAEGDLYYFDQDIIANVSYGYGYCFDWELAESDVTATTVSYDYGYAFSWEVGSFTGTGYHFTNTDDTYSTEDTYIWEENYATGALLEVSISPSPVNEEVDLFYSYGYSSAVTATATGATGTPTYSWSKISGDAVSIIGPTSNIVNFYAGGMSTFESRTAVYRVTVTDYLYTVTEDVSVTLTGGSEYP